MKKTAAGYQFSATDLVAHVNCRHLSALERQVAGGAMTAPRVWDPQLQILSERGSRHEEAYVAHLAASGLSVRHIEGAEVTNASVSTTLQAMRDGTQVIVQAALASGAWVGRADVLRRVETPSKDWSWSYEVTDTKLARETKAGAILQLCLYSDLVTDMQGIPPSNMYVIAPWSDFEPQRYRFADYAAYFRKVKGGVVKASAEQVDTYPEPISHCEICRWRVRCEEQRRLDDHLSLVAGISKLHINELRQYGVTTLAGLGAIPLPLTWKPSRGSADTYTRVREQARVQHEAREAGALKYERLPIEPGFGLACLPEPSDGDIFLDFEGDPFVGENGLEYLFGYLYQEDGVEAYTGDWALDRVAEKLAFEKFIDFVMARWAVHPGLHIYHYAPYEPAALKRLMGRYATREDELDRMLRAGLFVDLYQIVRRAVRASVESYSIKKMEPFFGFQREEDLADAGTALASIQARLELDDPRSIPEEVKAAVLSYNTDDCRSASALRDWLEKLRSEAIAEGAAIPRPETKDGEPIEKVSDRALKVQQLVDHLTKGVPVERDQRTPEQHGRWLLANILDFHRREEKAHWWEFFRLRDLAGDDLMDERGGLAGLTYVATVPPPPGRKARVPVHRYSFPAQDTDLRGGESLCSVGGAKLGTLQSISFEERTVEIRKTLKTADVHPEAVFAHDHVPTEVLADSLMRLAEYVAEHGLEGTGAYQPGRDLLLRLPPRTGGEPLIGEEERASDAAQRLCCHLEAGVLPIQGPPGAGKTYTGARMICELDRQGKTIGVTANSHAVILNLLEGVLEAAAEAGLEIKCGHRADDADLSRPGVEIIRSSAGLSDAMGPRIKVGGATGWHWARPDAFESVDVLFVDEAAQMSLANVLAVSQAAKTVVLLGDPQQLDHPLQGTHPDGTGVSALDHILDGAPTIPPDRGLFLNETWRLNPRICAFTSELFYDGKLRPRPGLDRQVITYRGQVSGGGLRYIPVTHGGNQNSSSEEADAVAELVRSLLDGQALWTDRDAEAHPLTLNDILIITPYNAQCFEIRKRLPGARVGTVDKFQGQEAPIAIYSMATSSQADAPRGMEFLYSLNRLNVATSRAKCLSILVSSPALCDAECRTPRHLQLVNAFNRYLELAESC